MFDFSFFFFIVQEMTTVYSSDSVCSAGQVINYHAPNCPSTRH